MSEVNHSTALRPALFNGLTLKIIAALSMIIDHIGAALFSRMMVLRYIGRMAFPIYCFLLVEGLIHSKNRRAYLLRLLVFAVISEVPFDLGLFHRLPYFHHQNVFMTLTLGVAMMWLCEILKEKYPTQSQLLRTGVFLAAALLAELAHTDYGAMGIAIIMAFYVFRERPLYGALLTGIMCVFSGRIEAWAILALPLILLYNGKRGPQPGPVKYFFYIYYPAHLTILYLIWHYAC